MITNNSNLYGQIQAEKLASDIQICREIVKEIGDFGINDKQRITIINLLAMELENNNLSREIVKLIRDSEDNMRLAVEE